MKRPRPDSQPVTDYNATPNKKGRDGQDLTSGSVSTPGTLNSGGNNLLKKSKSRTHRKYRTGQAAVGVISNKSKSTHAKKVEEASKELDALREMVLRPVSPGIISNPMLTPNANDKAKEKQNA